MFYAFQAIGIYKESDAASALKQRDYKDATDLVVLCGGGETVNEPVYMSDRKGNNAISTDGTAATLTAQEKERPLIGMSVVRRLIPEECEELQGFPIGWTLIGKPEEVEVKEYFTEWIPGENCEYADLAEAHRAYAEEHADDDNTGEDEEPDEDDEINFEDGFDPKKYGFKIKKTVVGSHTEVQYFYTDRFGKRKRCTDSGRYRAIGNSIAVGYDNRQSGFWMWLMKRISAQYERSATLGSLFDGICGFPLAWSMINGAQNCLWSSEIEEFCIEVARRRFPDPEDPAQD